jgi:hypothetical protein
MDIWTKQNRSDVMSRISSKDTRPELAIRSLSIGLDSGFGSTVAIFPAVLTSFFQSIKLLYLFTAVLAFT